MRMLKCIKMVPNGIVAMILNILSTYIVTNEFVLVKNIILHFSVFLFTQHADSTARITIMIAKNNRGALVTSLIVGGILAAALENEPVKCSKMVRLKINAIGLTLQCFIFIIIVLIIFLLFFDVIFIMTDLVVNIFDMTKQHQNIKQWNQELTATMCKFYLSCKDHFIFNCIKMLKIHLQRLQIFKIVKMIVNKIIFVILYDLLFNNIINVVILWIYTFLNDLLFYFIVFIFIKFISSVTIEIPSHIRRTTHQNSSDNIVLWIGFSVTTIGAEYIIHVTAVSTIESPDKNNQKIKNVS